MKTELTEIVKALKNYMKMEEASGIEEVSLLEDKGRGQMQGLGRVLVELLVLLKLLRELELHLQKKLKSN